MNLSIEVNIDEPTAFGVAKELGMNMEIVDTPEAPSRKPTLAEVDHYLEGYMRKTIINQYKPIVKKLYMAQINAMQDKMETAIEVGLEAAVKVGI